MTGVLDDFADVEGTSGVAGTDIELGWLAAFFVHVNRLRGRLDFDAADVVPGGFMKGD
jgi:hypothetical protein